MVIESFLLSGVRGNSILSELNHFFYSFLAFGLTSIVTLQFTLRIYLKFLLTCRPSYGIIRIVHAGMMELADVLDSKSSGSDTVRVRPPLPAPVIIQKAHPARPDPWIVAVGVGFLRASRITVPRSDTGRGDRRYRADACGQRQRAPRRYATRTAAPGLPPGAGAFR